MVELKRLNNVLLNLDDLYFVRNWRFRGHLMADRSLKNIF